MPCVASASIRQLVLIFVVLFSDKLTRVVQPDLRYDIELNDITRALRTTTTTPTGDGGNVLANATSAQMLIVPGSSCLRATVCSVYCKVVLRKGLASLSRTALDSLVAKIDAKLLSRLINYRRVTFCCVCFNVSILFVFRISKLQNRFRITFIELATAYGFFCLAVSSSQIVCSQRIVISI